MRRITLVIAVATVGLVLGLGPAAHAQTASSIPGLPAGQGGPDNQVNPSQGGNAPGGRDNPVVDAGPATSDDDDSSSIAPWLVGAALLAVLAAGGILLVRKMADSRGSDYAGRRTTV